MVIEKTGLSQYTSVINRLSTVVDIVDLVLLLNVLMALYIRVFLKLNMYIISDNNKHFYLTLASSTNF